MLIAKGVISDEQLEEALREQQVTAERLGTILDVATYEAPVPGYPGVIPHPTNVLGGQSIERSPVRRDTNDGTTDFTVLRGQLALVGLVRDERAPPPAEAALTGWQKAAGSGLGTLNAPE